MEPHAAQQEILLVKYSSFIHWQLLKKSAMKEKQSYNPDEQLEATCWNGWLYAMMPEIVATSNTGKKLYLWEIMQTKSLLNIKLAEGPQAIDAQHSINPYTVLATMCYG